MTFYPETSIFTFQAYGHKNITATHPTTLEFTTESELTSRGDCIVGVKATCSPSRFPVALRQALSADIGRAVLRIRTGAMSFEVVGCGSQSLTFQHSTEMVVRKSTFASDRTVLVSADKAARDIPRRMVQLLRNPKQLIEIEIRTI